MITIDLNSPFLNLDGKPSQDTDGPVKMGKILAFQLATATDGNPIKLSDWARALYNGSPLQVDKSDLRDMKDFINKSRSLTNLMKAQLLEKLDDCEKQSK